MSDPDSKDPGFIAVAEVEVDAVIPSAEGFVLEGEGGDGARYRLELHLDVPVDRRTRQVLGGLLSQSEWRVLRRATQSPLATLRRERMRARAAPRQSDSK
jgi:hypothetical protein